MSQRIYRMKTLRVGSGGDTILALDAAADWRGAAVNDAVRAVAATPPDATVAAFPGGGMINYLSRRANPTRYIGLTLPEVIAFGEDVMLRTFQMTPPDYILLVHKDTAEYGVSFFGSDPRYGRAIMDWVGRRYTTVHVIGRQPLHD